MSVTSHNATSVHVHAWSMWHSAERPVSVSFETTAHERHEVHLTVPQALELLGLVAGCIDFNKLADKYRAKPTPEPVDSPTIHEEDSEP